MGRGRGRGRGERRKEGGGKGKDGGGRPGSKLSDTLSGKNKELMNSLTCPRFTASVSAANAVNSTLEGRTVTAE